MIIQLYPINVVIEHTDGWDYPCYEWAPDADHCAVRNDLFARLIDGHRY